MLRMKRPIQSEAHDSAGELNVVPFLDILLNVLMFVLATVAVTFTTAIDSTPPKGRTAGEPPPGLALDVAVLDDGFLVSARGQRVGQGCNGTGAANAVPYDAIIHTMDAVRGGPGDELFPQVSFGVPR
jgi:biopolymer transport protein TolR